LNSLSLTEVRVLYELANREKPTATELCKELGLDPGYLSRILRAFHKRGWIRRESSQHDARHSLVSLSKRGRSAFEPLNARSNQEVAKMLSALGPSQQSMVVEAMETIESTLSPGAPEKAPYLLRTHQPGDIGWVVYRHGVLYSQEYGYDERFEALVARIVAEFVARYKKTVLWTQSELKAARSIYEKAGFRLVREEKHSSWSRDDLVAETWEIKL